MELPGWIPLPSIPSHRRPEGGETQSLHLRMEAMMGRRAGDRSQGTPLIRAQLGYRAPGEGLCDTQHFASSDLRCPRLWLSPTARLGREKPGCGGPGTPLASPLHHHHPGLSPLPRATASCCLTASRSGVAGYL